MKKYIWCVLLTGSLIYISSKIGVYFDMYINYWWFDEIIHFFGGMWAGSASWLGLYILSKTNLVKYISLLKYRLINIIFFVITGTIVFGVAWESHEYIFYYDRVFSPDTHTDIIMDIVGGVAVLLIYFSFLQYRKFKQ